MLSRTTLTVFTLPLAFTSTLAVARFTTLSVGSCSTVRRAAVLTVNVAVPEVGTATVPSASEYYSTAMNQ
jgi:hypothetical protein